MRMFRFTGSKAALAAGLLTGGLLLGAAAPAMADTTAPPPQVCAPGAMTITRGGPTVYDGVDCTPGSAAAPSAAGPSTAAPVAAAATPPSEPPAAPAAAAPAPAAPAPVSATSDTATVTGTPVMTVLRPEVVPASSTSPHPSRDWAPELEGAAIVVALAGAALLATRMARHRSVVLAEGAE